MDERRDAIFKSHDTATGPDDIHYQMLKHLHPNVMTTLLNSLNNIFGEMTISLPSGISQTLSLY